MDKLKVFVNGVRDDGYTKKGETTKTERFLADVYLPGTGGFDLPIAPQVYGQLLNVKPGTEALLPLRFEARSEVRKSAGGRDFAVRQLVPRFGDLELTAASGKAS